MDSQKIMIALLGVAFFAWFVLALVEFRRRPLRQAAVLCVLRGIALLFLFLLLDEFWRFSWRERPLDSPVVLLNDVSASMGLLPQKERERLTAFASVVRKKYSKTPGRSFKDYNFASVIAARNHAPGPSERRGTALGEALLKCALWHPSASIILISDGCDNAGLPAPAVIDTLVSSGVKIFPVSLKQGKAESSFDLVMGDGESAPGFSLDSTVRISGTVETEGVVPVRNCAIELAIDGQPRETKELQISSFYNAFEFRFPASLLKPGWHEYRLSLRPVPGELSTANNSSAGIFLIKEKNKVLVVWEGLNPELKALQPLLLSEYGNISISYAKDFALKSPDMQKDLLGGCGLLVLGNVAPQAFHQDSFNAFLAAIKNKESAIIFLHPDAIPGWLADESMSIILPVTQADEKFVKSTPLSFRFISGSDTLRLPLYSGRVLVPKSQAALKLSLGEPPGEFPLVISEGRVTCFAGIGSWRWKFSQEVRIRLAYERFWREFLQNYDFLKQDKLVLSLEESDKGFASEQTQNFLFKLTDMEPKIQAASYQLLKVATDTKEPIGSFTMGNGGLCASHELREPGIHWFFARKTGSSGNILAESSQIPVLVRDDRRESIFLKRGGELLALLASSNGGRIISPDASLDLPFDRSSLRLKCRNSENYPQEIIFAVLVFLALASEWFLRQRWSLS